MENYQSLNGNSLFLLSNLVIYFNIYISNNPESRLFPIHKGSILFPSAQEPRSNSDIHNNNQEESIDNVDNKTCNKQAERSR